jgi:predicted enzyme related to lactoylglutathione lyase
MKLLALFASLIALAGCAAHPEIKNQSTIKHMPEPKVKMIDYVEIPSRNLSQTKVFFESLFGWRFTDYGPDYASFDDGRLTGGFYTSSEVSLVSRGSALIIFYSPELEQSRDRVRALGATITKDIFSFPGGRRFQFTEPGGSEFAIWSDK